MIMISAAQVVLSIALVNESTETNENWNVLPSDIWILIYRFLCGVVIHMFLVPKI